MEGSDTQFPLKGSQTSFCPGLRCCAYEILQETILSGATMHKGKQAEQTEMQSQVQEKKRNQNLCDGHS